MNKAFLLVSIGLLLSCPVVFAEEEITPEMEITSSATIVKGDYSSQLIDKIKIERNTIYNALNLTPNQIKQKDEIENNRYKELETALKNYCLCHKKINDIKSSKNSDSKVLKNTQKELDSIKNDIKKISDKYDRQLKRILTSEQKTKYSMIRKLKRTEIKHNNSKHNSKKTPILRPFGVPISQAEYAEQQKNNGFFHKLFKKNK